ncbi:hypothetical protein GCM10010191_50420 [Actinomadura vinacea]|uniref:Uncharacterized protein n=1 Tax=Actinomadura vinacea TaxID=115336 RepID=A0ABN3JHW6_9ACTN
MVAAIARGLRLTPDERDHLFLLAGYRTALRDLRLQHVSPGLMRGMDGLAGTTAQVMGPLGETLLQTPSAVALLGDQTRYTGNVRSATYRCPCWSPRLLRVCQSATRGLPLSGEWDGPGLRLGLGGGEDVIKEVVQGVGVEFAVQRQGGADGLLADGSGNAESAFGDLLHLTGACGSRGAPT